MLKIQQQRENELLKIQQELISIDHEADSLEDRKERENHTERAQCECECECVCVRERWWCEAFGYINSWIEKRENHTERARVSVCVRGRERLV